MRLLLRADGNSRIGAGHVMRMLALAEPVLAEGGDVTLAAARLDDGLRDRASRAGIAVVQREIEPGGPDDWSWILEQAAMRRTEWVAVDGYRFDGSYQEALRAGDCRVLVVDDYGQCERYDADVILNQNVFAASAWYGRRPQGAKLLLGPGYALLRREFQTAGARTRGIDERADRVLVTLGGADPDNATTRVLAALSLVPDPGLRIKVVLGPSNLHHERVVAGNADPRVEILRATDDMAPLMAWADLAIAGAGSTVYELCCLGVPTLVVAIAPAQIECARALDRDGLSVNLGWHKTLDPPAAAQAVSALRNDRAERLAMSQRGRTRVDGRGAERVLAVLGESAGDA